MLAFLPFSAIAQVVPLFPANSSVQNSADFKMDGIFGENSLRIPLPSGNWTVRFVGPNKSTGNNPIDGIIVFLDQVIDGAVQSSIFLSIYPHSNLNWNVGTNCSGGVLVREIGSSVNGYCHSLKFTSFMENNRSDWQGSVRALWRDSSIKKPSTMVTLTSFSEQRGRYVVYLNYGVSPLTIGLPDQLAKDTVIQSTSDWWKENEKTPQAIDVIRWYEAYSQSVSLAVRGEQPTNDSVPIVESAIPKLKSLIQDFQLAKRLEPLTGTSNLAVASALRSDEIDALRVEREKLAAQAELERKRLYEAAVLRSAEIEALRVERERLAAEAALERKRLRELEEKLELAKVKPLAPPLSSERRVALVVGNSGYKNSPLTNPVNDAVDMSETLRSLGFQVTTVQDANLRKLREATRLFESSVSLADVALIFYAGHAVEAKGRNYLIPVDADVAREYELEDQAYDAQQWLAMLGDTKGTNTQRVNIVILDACRDNPVSRQWRSVSNGLGRMDAPSGTLLVYSTSPGKVASDGPKGQRNSPFTKSLLRSMQTPNVPVEQVLKDVRRQVLAETKGEQVPWENSSLIGDFVFKRQ
jgi:hypothetical protein